MIKGYDALFLDRNTLIRDYFSKKHHFIPINVGNVIFIVVISLTICRCFPYNAKNPHKGLLCVVSI